MKSPPQVPEWLVRVASQAYGSFFEDLSPQTPGRLPLLIRELATIYTERSDLNVFHYTLACLRFIPLSIML